MKRLLVTLIVLAATYVAAEAGTKFYAESQIVQQVESEVRSNGASASVSVPVVYPVLAESDISSVRVSVRGIDVGPFVSEEVTARFTGVRIDRDASFRDRALRVSSIEELTATAEISDAEVSKILPPGLSFRFEQDAVVLNLPGGLSLRGRFERARDGFRFRPGRDELPGGIAAPSFRFDDIPYLSCFSKIEIRPGRAVISCVIEDPPPPPELIGTSSSGR